MRKVGNDGRVFVDRCGRRFEGVLNYLRGGVVLGVGEVGLWELKEEAEFYGAFAFLGFVCVGIEVGGRDGGNGGWMHVLVWGKGKLVTDRFFVSFFVWYIQGWKV